MAELSFGDVSSLVAILTSTFFKEVQSLVPVFVPRFPSLTFVFLKVYVSSIPLHALERYNSSYSGCRRAIGDWGYLSHGFARKIPGPKSNRKCVRHSREILDCTSPAISNEFEIAIVATREMAHDPSIAHWQPRTDDAYSRTDDGNPVASHGVTISPTKELIYFASYLSHVRFCLLPTCV